MPRTDTTAAFMRSAIALLAAACLLGSCIGPGLEPPKERASTNVPTVSPPIGADASTAPGFGNSGTAGANTGTGTTGPQEPAPQPPDLMTDPERSSDGSDAEDEDAGTDTDPTGSP